MLAHPIFILQDFHEWYQPLAKVSGNPNIEADTNFGEEEGICNKNEGLSILFIEFIRLGFFGLCLHGKIITINLEKCTSSALEF